MSPHPRKWVYKVCQAPALGWVFIQNKKIAPALGHVLSSIHFLGRFLTEEYVNLHRNQVSPALGRIFITYMICPGFGLVICEKSCTGFGLSFGFHGVHPYQKNICSHPPPPPPPRLRPQIGFLRYTVVWNYKLQKVHKTNSRS